ncbi:hypothetical protein AVEN_212363-1 [Araneus ventricosus]|uniref:CCHC-type domain-containing protein n=1 Tax=Araneus ventricosus TaxID=182803 RepID=A0A4Y2U7U0_ARAVE|nr:hypothetical protein AVEN_212363-1 [Araneus ventricosus]
MVKRKVSQEVEDHFIDDWYKLNAPDDLVEKLDDYDTLRSTFRRKQPRKEGHYDKRNSSKDDSAISTNGNKKLYGITHNEKGEPKCFNCSKFGHISKDCPIPKPLITCRVCNKTGLFIQMIKAYQQEKDDQRDWDSKIEETERNLNNTVNKTLRKIPFEILHGYVPRFKDRMLRLFADEEHEVWNDPEKLQLEAREKIAKAQEKMKAYYDEKKSGT